MSNPTNFYRNAYKPLIYSLILAFGTVLGMAVSRMSADKQQSILKPSYSKIDQVMDFIKYKYVDTISKSQLEEQTIEELLSSLDPHSSYIPEKDMKAVNEELDGNFEGIGVEFYIVKDTITIVSAISGGPAESVGLQAGDRIITIDDTVVAGIKIQNKDVMRKLKGVGGTKVKVGVSRGGSSMLKSFTITRGEIPLYSIDATYLIDPKTGYIKINRFSASTISEFRKALRSLTQQGIERLVLDLRQNPGGYLQAATEIVDELLGGEKMIVYTQGKSVGKMEYFSKKPGLFERGKLAILIDQNSASASEILSGAIQDWDRGVIIGRTSFGKGLVQEQFEMGDGSALRLTVARYYTPSGRSIQRPYTHGASDYYEDIYARYNKGFFVHEDTTQVDSLKFSTASGRTVYGGGGIRPDIFVPLDTTEDVEFLFKVRTLIPEFVYRDFSLQPNRVEGFKDMYDFSARFQIADELMASFKAYVKSNGITDDKKFAQNQQKITNYMRAFYAKKKWHSDAFFLITNQSDNVLATALQSFQQEKLLSGK